MGGPSMNWQATKRRLWVGMALLAAGGAAGWFWLGSLETPATTGGSQSAPFVRVGGRTSAEADQIVREQAAFFDPTPLFLPTPVNYGSARLPSGLEKQPGQAFGDFGPKLVFTGGRLESFGLESVGVAESIAEVLSRSNEVPFAGMGEIDAVRQALQRRPAAMSIKDMAGRDLSFSNVETPGYVGGDFAPLEFVVLVSAAGLVGSPILVAGSGNEQADAYFADHLVGGFRLGAKLNPGRYRVVIGP